MSEADDDLAAIERMQPWWQRFGVPNMLGLAILAVPFFVSFTLNGRDFVKLGAGALAILVALIAAGWALFGARKRWAMLAMSGVVLLGGASHVVMSGLATPLTSALFDHEGDVRAILGEQGFTDVTISPVGDDGLGFEFSGHQHGDWCRGSIHFTSTFGASNELERTCGLPEPIELLEEGCEHGTGERCAQLAERLRGEEPVDRARAFLAEKRACDLGQDAECFYVGVAQQYGENGVEVDLVQARALYRRACSAGSLPSCFRAGVMSYNGRGGERDYAGACEAWRRACDAEYGLACVTLGEAYQDGHGVEQSAARAIELFDRACDLHEAAGCESLGRAYRDGNGVERDVARAADLFRAACDADDGAACTNLAALYLHGEAVERDEARALELYRSGCVLESPSGCRNAALLLLEGRGTEADPAAAVARLRQLCDEEEDPISCFELGVELHEGTHVTEDRPEAYRIFSRGCELGGGKCCRDVGIYLEEGFGGVERDAARARTFFARACELGEESACRR